MTPAEPQSTEQLIELIGRGIGSWVGTAVDGQEMIDTVLALLNETAHPDFVTVMVDQAGIPAEHPGVDGFEEGLSDWISPYERFRLRFDEVIPAGENVLVFLVRQLGTTKHGGVAVESPGASVWWVEDGMIRQAAFYLDQRGALKAAGLDPDRHLSG